MANVKASSLWKQARFLVKWSPALLALIATAVHITLIFKSKLSQRTVVSLHWNKNVAIWRNFRHWLHRKFIFTSHNAAADDDIVNMTTIPFQLMNVGPNFSDTNLQSPQYPGADGSSCRGSWAVTTIFRGLLQHILPDANYAWVHPLKAKYRQFDNFVVIGGTVSCHYDNWWCHQWRHSYQIDNQLFQCRKCLTFTVTIVYVNEIILITSLLSSVVFEEMVTLSRWMFAGFDQAKKWTH